MGLEGLKPTLVMIVVQMILVVVNLSYKCALNDGMRPPVLVAYRNMFGASFMLPLSFVVERKKRPKLTAVVVFYGSLCGLFIGSLGQNLFLEAMALTSATFVSAMMNLVPAITFVVAICLRIEKLQLNSPPGIAKVVGTLTGIGGAMLLTFYKGPELPTWNTNINLLQLTTTHSPHEPTPTHHNSILGVVLSMGSCVTYALWLIVQSKAIEQYPCPYTFAAIMTLSATAQSVVYAVCTEKDWSNWLMGWDIRLFTAAVSGILGSGVMFTLVAWCVRMRGPLFVAVFNPLLLVMVAIAGSFFMDEELHVGMLLGGILIIIGLYVVLWGNGKELKKRSQLMSECEQHVHDDMPLPLAASWHSISSHDSGNRKSTVEEDMEQERRDSQASSEVLGGVYIYP